MPQLVFKAERDAGLAEKLAVSSLQFASLLKNATSTPRNADAIKAKAEKFAKASISDADLHYLDSVLCSTGWNLNDDVFDPLETWAARSTPVHKQFNMEHDDANIVGHITSCRPVANDGTDLTEALSADEVPDSYHLLTGGVLYKSWQKEELQERMDRVLAEIAEGKWFVSMECLFSGFDYAMKARSGENKVVARTADTAFLTKHLRAYGGTGEYQGTKIGRLMRNICFSGKGLVKEPANPESLILPPSPQTFSYSRASVYTPEVPVLPKGENAVETEKLKAELDAAKVERDNFKSDSEKAKAAKSEVENSLLKSEESLKTLKAEAEAKKAEFEKAKSELEKAKSEAEAAKVVAEKAASDARTELDKLAAEKRKSERESKAAKSLGFDATKATEFVKNCAKFDDAEFDAQLASLEELVKANKPTGDKKVEPTPDLKKAEPEPAVASVVTGGGDDKAAELGKSIGSYLKRNGPKAKS